MRCLLVLPGQMAERFRELVSLDIETGGVLLAKPVPTAGGLRLLAHRFLEVPTEAYERREAQELLIRSEGYVPALRIAEDEGCLPIWFHTHPGRGSDPTPSDHDLGVNVSLANTFRIRADSEFYGFLIMSGADGELSFSGALEAEDRDIRIDRLWIVGSGLELVGAIDSPLAAVPSMFDRNVRAFGGAVQAVLGELRVAVIGCGGTGSAVAEQLVRLGVRHLDLFDPDHLSDSNVTRVYGSTLADVGRRKVDVLAGHLSQITGDLDVTKYQATITEERTAHHLVEADIIFGCTDDNAGRLVLSRASTYLTAPVIDCGVLLSSDSAGRLTGIHGRVTVMTPGQACLVCRQRIDLARARSEQLTSEERDRLVGEGYAPALPGVEPAVVAYTSAVAAAAVAELIERLTDYGDDPRPSEVLLRLHDREVSTNNQLPNSHHYCDVASEKIGLGLTEPFLGQTW